MVCVVTDGRRIVATVACGQALFMTSSIAIRRFGTINTGKLSTCRQGAYDKIIVLKKNTRERQICVTNECEK